jgi:hypothetical protein
MKDDFGFVLICICFFTLILAILILVITTIIDDNVFKSCESINHYYINEIKSIKCEVIRK